MESAKKPWSRAGELAERVGRVVSDAVTPSGFDDYPQLTGDSAGPAIFLQSEFFGGRTRVGASIDSLSTPGAILGTAMFSWLYLFPFLRSLSSAWEFLPFSRTEFVRITLEQKIMWKRVSSAFVSWIVVMVAFLVLSIAFAFVAAIPLPSFFVWVSVYVVANLLAWKQLAGLTDDELHRSQIILEYGFPRKYQLLSGLSDAPVENQLDGVMKLCKALSRAQFSQWDQFSTHGDGGGFGLLSAMFNKISRRV